MLKLLIKKQLAEVFRSYFYNFKKNKARSRGSVVLSFVMYGVLMVGVLGGIFTYLSSLLCAPLSAVGMDWLYFLVMSGLALFLGAFGSIFSTYSELYLAKDNDFLLSLPIPVKYIIASRLINSFLIGTMYSAMALVPALVIYYITAGLTAARLIGGVLLALSVFLLVAVLSCLLGWCVAKISVKLKRKSFTTVLVSLLGVGLYYFVSSMASKLVQNLIANAATYGGKISSAARWLYYFSCAGTGNVPAAAVTLAVTLVLAGLTWLLLRKTFLSIATHVTGGGKKKAFVLKKEKVKSPFGALLGREIGKFTASPNYMLNCGLGILFTPLLGLLLLWKGGEFLPLIDSILPGSAGGLSVIMAAAAMALCSMIDTAAPSVSLEGKNIWLPQSLPVSGGAVLGAKVCAQLVLGGAAVLFLLLCSLPVMPGTAAQKALYVLVSLLYTVFSALFGCTIGLKMPILNWSNEIIPIKQSGAVAIALFGGWGVTAVFAVAYFMFGTALGAASYMAIWAAVLAIADFALLKWLNTKGAEAFGRL